MCFSNAVLQLLVHSPPLWNLFRQLGDLEELRGEGGPATGGGATPLMDATVRFFEEFMDKGKEPPPTLHPPRQADGKPREGGEAKKEPNVVDSFEPTYIYDAMKEKRKLKGLLVRSRAT
jgi:ubiquitin carboxyl-terminal hydrolase 10